MLSVSSTIVRFIVKIWCTTKKYPPSCWCRRRMRPFAGVRFAAVAAERPPPASTCRRWRALEASRPQPPPPTDADGRRPRCSTGRDDSRPTSGVVWPWRCRPAAAASKRLRPRTSCNRRLRRRPWGRPPPPRTKTRRRLASRRLRLLLLRYCSIKKKTKRSQLVHTNYIKLNVCFVIV